MAARRQGLAVGVLTRNGLRAVERALRRFTALTVDDFDVVVTRDDGHVAPKPAPDGVLHAAAAMGVAPEETLVVGDFLLDMRAGRAAGAVTAYLVNHGAPGDGEAAEPDDADCDFVVGRLPELEDVVRLGLPLPPGKLPNDLLAGFLAGVAGDDPALIVSPGVGEDVAAIDVAGAEVLVVHGDPITLGGEDVGRAAVLVNVNDIAAAGADPRWLLATVLLPRAPRRRRRWRSCARSRPRPPARACTLAGGHTEVTDAVTRPVVSLTALGTVGRAELKDKRSARTGDRVLLTKELAMEGAALLAGELGERLRALGMTAAELDACRALQERASILPEARIARGFAGVRALHDVTEGGLADGAARAGRGDGPRRARARRPRPRLGGDAAPLRPAGRRPAGAHRLRQPARVLRSGGGRRPARRARGGRDPGRRHRRAHRRGRRRRRAASAAGRRPGRTSRPTRPRGCWQSGRRIRKRTDGRGPAATRDLVAAEACEAGGRAALRGP